MAKVERKPKLIKNAISDQNKTTPSSLTVKEWNYIINVLKTQTNLNTEYLDKLHYILFGSSESDFIETPSLPEVKDMFIELKEVLETIENEFEEYQTDVNNDVQDFKDAIESAFGLYKHGINVDVTNLKTVTKAQINDVIYTPANGHLTFYKQDGTDFSIDLPLELIVSSGTYEEATKEVVLTLANDDVINIPISAILDGIATVNYVDDQITERQAIVKIDIPPLNETDLVYFMQELEDGVYKIQTELWGHEFLFVSDMNLPIDPNAEESELELVKEYSRYTSNGSSYRYDFDLQAWAMAAGGGGGGGGGGADTNLQNQIDDNTSAINSEATTRANADSGLDTRLGVVEGALPNKANASDVYLKTETYTKAETSSVVGNGINTHNNSLTAHNDIRQLISNIEEIITVIDGENDADSMINKLHEIVALLNGYAEGTTLVDLLSGKVDKVEGYGLSQENFTPTLKTKLDNIPTTFAPTDAQKNSDITKAEIEATLTGAINTHKHSYNNLDDKPTIPTIPDLALNDNTETSGKYISKIEVDGTDKHKLIVTKADLPQDTVDLNEMAYFNYAGSIYGAKYGLLANAWQDMKDSETVLFDIPLTLAAPEQEMGGMTIDLYVGTNGQLQALYDACVNETITPNDVYYVNNVAVATIYLGDVSGDVGFPIPLYEFGIFGVSYDTTSFLIGDLTPLSMGLGLVLAKPVDVSIPNNNIVIQQGFKFENENGIIIPNSVTNIVGFAFRDWTSNNQPLVIPNSVTSIGRSAFSNWTSNNQPLVIPDSVTEIEFNTFESWLANNQPLVIPNSVTSIDEEAFRSWEANNQPLVIPDSVTYIGQGAFDNWTSNNQPLVIPNSVTNIVGFAFSNWTSNNQPLTISNSITDIEQSAFSGWSSNNQLLVIPDSVTRIEDNAFSGWSSNNQPLVIPESVTYIGNYAFGGWTSAKEFIFEGETPTLTIDAFDNTNNAPIYVPDASVEAYKTSWVHLADRIFPISEYYKKSETYSKTEIDAMFDNLLGGEY